MLGISPIRSAIWGRASAACGLSISSALLFCAASVPARATQPCTQQQQTQTQEQCGQTWTALGAYVKWVQANDRGDTENNSTLNQDPWVDITGVKDKGATQSSATGAFGAVNGLSQSSHTSDVGAGAEAAYNASKTFNLTADQRVVFDGRFTYDSATSTFNANPALPAVLSMGSDHTNTYALTGAMRYIVGDTSFAGHLTGAWGNGGMTNNATGAVGSFTTDGYMAGVSVTRTYTLFGSNGTPAPALPTKAPPRTAAPGNSLYLIVGGDISHVGDQVNGFTDSTGFVRGDEQLRFWEASAGATLVAAIPANGVIWRPYLGANLDQQFGFSHTLGVPGDIISYGSAQTFVGMKGGMNALLANGLILGAEGFFEQSAEIQAVGGRAYVRYYFP